MKKLSVFGLGKLGCTMAACFAHKGFEVIGVDVVKETVAKINNGESPIPEPGVDKLIKRHKSRITATDDGKSAVLNTGASFVIVPTPSNSDGSFSIKYVVEACGPIGHGLAQKKGYHLVVITSTVLPGDMDKIQLVLEKVSKKKCGKDFGLCYSPDFIAIGQIVKDFLNPDMILIGQSDPSAGRCLEEIHRQVADNDPSIHRMSFQSAELTK